MMKLWQKRNKFINLRIWSVDKNSHVHNGFFMSLFSTNSQMTGTDGRNRYVVKSF